VTRTLAAEIVIARSRQDVYEFLAPLENHWEIAGNRLVDRYEQLDERTARVHFGPPGMRRWATSRITRLDPPGLIEGEAATARSDGTVRWVLDDAGATMTRVRFEQELRPQPLDDRIAVALTAWWLRRHYRRTLVRLRAQLETPRPG